MEIRSIETKITIEINDIERNALIRLLSNERIKGWEFHDRKILENICSQLKLTKE